jgi:hypothetical protein
LTCPKHGRIFAYGVFENGTPFWIGNAICIKPHDNQEK